MYLHKYFKGKVNGAPKEFDIYADDERTGENCAQITARTGNTELLQWLFEKVKIPLKDKVNKRGENALQLACIGSKKYKEMPFMSTVKYLVENVGIDVTYEYEETLLAVQDNKIAKYLENRLRILGIETSKNHIDRENSFSRNRVQRPVANPELEERLKDLSSHFEFQEVFQDELKEESQVPSSIYAHSQLEVDPSKIEVSFLFGSANRSRMSIDQNAPPIVIYGDQIKPKF